MYELSLRPSCRADLSSAIARHTKPRFPYSPNILATTLPSDSVQNTVDPLIANMCAEISSLQIDLSGTRGLSAIIHDLERLSLVIKSANRADITEMDSLKLSDCFYDVERRAYDLFQVDGVHLINTVRSGSNVLLDLPSALYTACCLAGIIYSYVGLREIPSRAGIFTPLLADLTHIIQNIDTLAACTAYPKLLFWVLNTGGIAAKGREERHQYVKFLADLCEKGMIPNGRRTGELARGLMHVTPMFLAECLDVWNEVEELLIMRHLCYS